MAKITKGYSLLAKHVIHTVGPQSEKPAILANCYRSSLQVLAGNQLPSIAFLCIATGVYRIDCQRIIDFQFIEQFDQVVFVLFNEKDNKIYNGRPTLYIIA
ncbi:hypothetical protein PS6_002401 [Mucor atramentarius]